MDISVRVERACAKAGITQAKLAWQVGLSPSTLYGALHGRHNLAPAHVGRIARRIGSAEVAMAFCNTCEANLFGPRFLDGVSRNPLSSFVKGREELWEALEALERLARRLVNKETADDLNEADRQAVDEYLDQIIDLWGWLGTTLALTVDTYKRDPDVLVCRHLDKCRQRGYLEWRDKSAA